MKNFHKWIYLNTSTVEPPSSIGSLSSSSPTNAVFVDKYFASLADLSKRPLVSSDCRFHKSRRRFWHFPIDGYMGVTSDFERFDALFSSSKEEEVKMVMKKRVFRLRQNHHSETRGRRSFGAACPSLLPPPFHNRNNVTVGMHVKDKATKKRIPLPATTVFFIFTFISQDFNNNNRSTPRRRREQPEDYFAVRPSRVYTAHSIKQLLRNDKQNFFFLETDLLYKNVCEKRERENT